MVVMVSKSSDMELMIVPTSEMEC